MRGFIVMGAVLALPLGTAALEAHGLSTSYTEITITPTRLEVRCLVSLNEIVTHFPIGVRTDERLGPQELDAAMTGIFAFLGEHVTLAVTEQPWRWSGGRITLIQARHSSDSS
jgi:hypothetical protein